MQYISSDQESLVATRSSRQWPTCDTCSASSRLWLRALDFFAAGSEGRLALLQPGGHADETGLQFAHLRHAGGNGFDFIIARADALGKSGKLPLRPGN